MPTIVRKNRMRNINPPKKVAGEETRNGGLSSDVTRNEANGRKRLFLGGGGHDVAGLGGEAGAFELDGDVVDGEGVVEFLADGGEDGFAFVHAHIGDAGVARLQIPII